MKLRTFFIAVAVFGVLFGLALIFAPRFMDQTFGGATSPSEMVTDGMLGAQMLGLAVVVWLAKDLGATTVRPIITGNLLGGAVGFVVSLIGTLNGAMQGAGWVVVALYLLFTLGFAYFQFLGRVE